MKKKIILIAAACLVVILAALWHNSYALALLAADVPASAADMVDAGVDENGREFRVTGGVRADGSAVLAYCVRNAAGVWEVAQLSDTRAGEELASVGWLRVVTANRFDVSDGPLTVTEGHIAVAGNSAQKLIELAPADLPDGVTADLRQSGPAFVLHFTGHGGDALSGFSAEALLREDAYIS